MLGVTSSLLYDECRMAKCLGYCHMSHDRMFGVICASDLVRSKKKITYQAIGLVIYLHIRVNRFCIFILGTLTPSVSNLKKKFEVVDVHCKIIIILLIAF